jgi:hypothetical protein
MCGEQEACCMWWPPVVVVAAVILVLGVGLWQRRWLRLFGVHFGQTVAKYSRILRRLAAAGFFLTSLAFTLISNFTSHLQVCEEQIARVGSVPTVRTCGSMSIDSAPILILVIAAGVCLLPEWNVLEIPGVLRVEKKVNEQGRRQEEILRILQQINISQRQNLTVAIIRSIDELGERYDAFTSRPPQPGDDQR